jgi:hypothetical protein
MVVDEQLGYVSAMPRDVEDPSASRSSVGLARLDGSARLLRLQADERLATMLEVETNNAYGAGLLTIPSREAITVGVEIRVEISFGPMADEITLRGVVERITARGDRAPLIAIRIDPELAARVRYIHEVLSEGRQATARKSRRVAADVQATWYWGLGSHATRLSDISKGGAFIRSGAPPSTGSTITLEIDDHMIDGGSAEPLKLEAVVAWAGRSQGRRGFGVRFRIVDRVQAGRIAALVRWHERVAGLID